MGKFSLEISKFLLALQPEALVNTSGRVLFSSPAMKRVDPDEMLHSVVFHLAIHNLPWNFSRDYNLTQCQIF